jgi:hypothetical protein
MSDKYYEEQKRERATRLENALREFFGSELASVTPSDEDNGQPEYKPAGESHEVNEGLTLRFTDGRVLRFVTSEWASLEIEKPAPESVKKCTGTASDEFLLVVPEPDADYLAKQADILIQSQWASIERESVEHFRKSGGGLDAYCRVLNERRTFGELAEGVVTFGPEPSPEDKANRILPDITFTFTRKP